MVLPAVAPGQTISSVTHGNPIVNRVNAISALLDSTFTLKGNGLVTRAASFDMADNANEQTITALVNPTITMVDTDFLIVIPIAPVTNATAGAPIVTQRTKIVQPTLGTTQIGNNVVNNTTTVGADRLSFTGVFVFTAGESGVHTVQMTLQRVAGAGTLRWTADGTTQFCYIRWFLFRAMGLLP